jgi:hypothetical protein
MKQWIYSGGFIACHGKGYAHDLLEGKEPKLYVQYLNPVLSRKGKPHCYVDPSGELIDNKYQKRRKFRLARLVYSASSLALMPK